MTQLIRRPTCLKRIWKQSEDVLFKARDPAGLQVRGQSQLNVCMSKGHQPKHLEDATSETGTVSNSSTPDNAFLLSTVGIDALTNLCQLVKHFLSQKCVSFYVSEPIFKKCDCSSSSTKSVERIHNKQNVNFLDYTATGDFQCFIRSETLSEISGWMDPLSLHTMSGHSCQSALLHRQLLKKHHQFSSCNISSHCVGYHPKVNYSMWSHQVKHYSISQHSNRYFLYSDNKDNRLLSVHHLSTTPTVNLFSSLAIHRHSCQMRQPQILASSPLIVSGLKHRWISKKTYEFPELPEDDLVESFMRGGGAGGQAVAKTNNCVLLLHKPTGIQVKMHVSRSLEVNRKKAREKMIEKLDFHFNKENSFNEQKKAEKSRAKQKMKKKAELVREKMKAFKKGLEKMDNED